MHICSVPRAQEAVSVPPPDDGGIVADEAVAPMVQSESYEDGELQDQDADMDVDYDDEVVPSSFSEFKRILPSMFPDVPPDEFVLTDVGSVSAISNDFTPSSTWAWPMPQSLQRVLTEHASSLQGISKGSAEKLSSFPLGSAALQCPSTKFFTKTSALGNRPLDRRLRWNPANDFQPDQPRVSHPRGAKPAVLHSPAWHDNTEALVRSATILVSQADQAVSFLVQAAGPMSDDMSAAASLAASAMSAALRQISAAAANFTLLQRDTVLSNQGLQEEEIQRARAAPFVGNSVLGPSSHLFPDYMRVRNTDAALTSLVTKARAQPRTPASFRGRGRSKSVARPRLSSDQYRPSQSSKSSVSRGGFRGNSKRRGGFRGRGSRGSRSTGSSASRGRGASYSKQQ